MLQDVAVLFASMCRCPVRLVGDCLSGCRPVLGSSRDDGRQQLMIEWMRRIEEGIGE